MSNLIDKVNEIKAEINNKKTECQEKIYKAVCEFIQETGIDVVNVSIDTSLEVGSKKIKHVFVNIETSI